MGAVRGTTPEYSLTLDGYDLTGQTIYVTLAQGSVKFTLDKKRLSVATDDSGSTVAFSLTQSETLRFKAGNVEIQLKCINSAGRVDATGIGTLIIDRALLDKEIVYANNTD